MALDAVCLQGVVEELRPQILGARIEKVQQPARDQVVLLLRGSRRLLLNAGTGAPRIQLTQLLRENPAEPPMFCMLLRKHLAGGRIAAITQPPMERLVQLEVDVIDEFGQPGKRTLVLEAMGRRSNLVLLDGEGRIIDCLRRVDAEMSAARQILPGLYYALPVQSSKCPFVQAEEEQLLHFLNTAGPEDRLDSILLDRYFGLSPLAAREIVYRTTGDTDTRLFQLDGAGRTKFAAETLRVAAVPRDGTFVPYVLHENGKPLEYSYMPITQYGSRAQGEQWESFSAMLDEFYARREQQERVRQRGQDLIRTATTVRDRLRRKLAQQEKDYAATQDRDRLRICGDLITANLYRMERGPASFTTENFYDEQGGDITIRLDPLLTPQQNAAKYYKRYNKAKTAEQHLREQMEIAGHELTYMESVLEEIAEAESEQDFIDIRNELKDAGYIRRQARDKREQSRPARPRAFTTTGGFRVLVGRNNRQNDKLTMKEADHRDIWFHTQKIHGSHVILCTGGLPPEEQDIREAAGLAAYYSQARESSGVPVDYTPVKNVKKPAGAHPGMVIYTTYRTIYVTPEADLADRLQSKKK